MKKTKAMLLKEFNTLQKDYLSAIRAGDMDKVQEIMESRRELQMSIRKVDNRYVNKK